MIEDFHFLRPAWLLAIPAAALLLWVIRNREDIRKRWGGVIAPHLLDHLVVDRRGLWRVRPVHLTVAAIVLGGLAAAGPTWERERPPFVEDKAPLAIVVDLSPTMDAIDVAPSRIERAKLKVRDLLALRPGARTAVYAYGATAHQVLPLTEDAALVTTYVDAFATRLMPPGNGKDTAKALAAAEAGLSREDTPGTILFLTDGVEGRGADAMRAYAGEHEIMVLGIGTPEGGPVKTGKDTFLAGPGGARVFAKLDVDALKALKGAGVKVATITPDDADVQWIARRVQTHLQQKLTDEKARWKDVGWWLVIPIALCGALWFRRGWTIRWATAFAGAALGLAFTTLPQHAHAADLLSPFLTPDQEGRLAFERGDFASAAERFTDPLWKGAAYYRAGKFDDAVDAFARSDTDRGWFNQGNALAKLGKYPAAVACYQEALKRRPGWPEATRNLELVRKLVPPDKKDEDGEEGTNQKPDEVKFDDKGKQGKKGQVEARRLDAEMWMRNIQATPADLLARKFALEAKGAKP